ncbi:probable gluconokinase isoform X1 [Meriones unguiculatus]|uniref:probable gluconokinase isoform X1 n=2 Tax=Meriones unguiculatus TaxID=10047 RepID=UPI00293E39C6|nr:probable gluconokinase isoform X1 [Meriones unguiculatus]XP_060236557.1 probable gluconokinase isoform X1 [Meriones unguiculatus]
MQMVASCRGTMARSRGLRSTEWKVITQEMRVRTHFSALSLTSPGLETSCKTRSTVGELLASKLGWKFYDADDYHSAENRTKMQKGVPLSDQDRIPWLCSLHDILLRDVALGQHVVLACSALKKMYRDILIRGNGGAHAPSEEPAKEEALAGAKLLVVYLCGSFEIISGRLLQRKGHFMPPELLQSQFSILEPPTAPENFIQISVDKSVPEIAAAVMEALK